MANLISDAIAGVIVDALGDTILSLMQGVPTRKAAMPTGKAVAKALPKVAKALPKVAKALPKV